jgi:AhpD family alkylhydroperoxidase
MLLPKELADKYFEFTDAVFETGKLDLKVKELIAVSCSILLDCTNCFDYHFKKAAEAGADVDEIKEAVAVALAVGGGSKFAKFRSKMAELERDK